MGSLRVLAGVLAAGRLSGSQSFIHDAPDGAGTAAALSAAAQAMIDLARRPRRFFAVGQRTAHIVVREHVAGTDNHCEEKPGSQLVRTETINSLGVSGL
jgi:hypothetical protein